MKTFQIYSSYTELPEAWKQVTAHDVFLQPNYFKALEKVSPENIQFYYIGVFNEGVLVGVAIIQRVQLYLKDMFRKTSVSCLKTFFQSVVAKILKGNILVVGNLMHTGQHGMFYDGNLISATDYLKIVFDSLEALKIEIKETQNKKIRVVMLKDFFEDDAIHNQKEMFLSQKLHNVFVQPNMIMTIRKNWLAIQDYSDGLKKKYRTRFKRTKKKFGNITSTELDVKQIQESSARIYELYLNVSNNAKFNTFILPKFHFYNLKVELEENFKVFGYYLNDELVGFYSLILNNETLETCFLGYDTLHQHPNQLYLNMLYDMTKYAIDNAFAEIVFARTAMEIKSSVGANPKGMRIYLKHTNSFINAILKQVFKLMNPPRDWEERHPFKV